jgi:hypothetical protein
LYYAQQGRRQKSCSGILPERPKLQKTPCTALQVSLCSLKKTEKKKQGREQRTFLKPLLVTIYSRPIHDTTSLEWELLMKKKKILIEETKMLYIQ